jgi:hypothetical protein
MRILVIFLVFLDDALIKPCFGINIICGLFNAYVYRTIFNEGVAGSKRHGQRPTSSGIQGGDPE